MKKVITILLAIVFLAGGMATQAEAALQARGPVIAPATLPSWYQDTQGLQLADCNDVNGFCLIDPLGLEGFYWMASAALPAPLNGLLVLALETNPPNIVFARIRIRFDAPAAGDYTVTHPFGKITLTGLAPGIRAGNVTMDIPGLVANAFDAPLANDPLQAGTVNADGRSIGPFLIPADAPFVRDPVSGNVYIAQPGVLHTVTGSPFGTNFFRIEGPGLPPGGVTETLFDMVGKVANCVAPAVNAAPVAVPELVPVATGQALAVNVIANDTDDLGTGVQGTPGIGVNRAAITVTVPPASGTAVPNLDGTVTYTPNPGFFGLDTFTYTVQDYCMVPSNAVVENVIVEQLTAPRTEFRPKTGKWTITGESSLVTVPVVPGLPGGGNPNTITLRKGSATGPVIGTTDVRADGTWKFMGKSKTTLPGAQPQNVHVESSATVILTKPLKMQ